MNERPLWVRDECREIGVPVCLPCVLVMFIVKFKINAGGFLMGPNLSFITKMGHSLISLEFWRKGNDFLWLLESLSILTFIFKSRDNVAFSSPLYHMHSVPVLLFMCQNFRPTCDPTCRRDLNIKDRALRTLIMIKYFLLHVSGLSKYSDEPLALLS